MSQRYNRPRTPPSPPAPSRSRKQPGHGPSASVSSSKSLSSDVYNDRRPYNKYEKSYKTTSASSSSSSTYQSSSKASYPDDKYRSDSSRRVSDKPVSKYVGKSDPYGDEAFKLRDANDPRQRYGDKNTYDSRYTGKGPYQEKYAVDTTDHYHEKYSGKKYSGDYDSYQNKTSKYPKHDSDMYYGGAGSSFNTYSSYDNYSSDRLGSSTANYGGGGGDGYYEGRGTTSSYGGLGDKIGGIGYGGDKPNRGSSSYGVSKQGRGGASNYGGEKPGGGARSRMYGDENPRNFHDYTPPRTTRSPPPHGSARGYDTYNHYSPPPVEPKRQYLDRYVIGDSVVYGPPGQYPSNLGPTSLRGRPPSPPSPHSLTPRSFTRYSDQSPKRYNVGSKASSLHGAVNSTKYRSPSPARRGTSPRRPPSPKTRRPPSPDYPYLRRTSQDRRSYERINKPDGYSNRSRLSCNAGNPNEGNRSPIDRRGHDRSRERERRKEPERSPRERTHESDFVKRGRPTNRNADCQSWNKDGVASTSQNYNKNRSRDERNIRSPPSRNSRGDASLDRKDINEEGERSRRLEDRLGLGPSPISQNATNNPMSRPQVSRSAISPRDNKSRRPDDLRLWIESRKNEGSKRSLSPNRARPMGRPTGRSNERTPLARRPRLGDPKKRLGGGGGGGKARRRVPPQRRNKILKKYQRLAVRRGVKGGGSGGGGGGNKTTRSGKESVNRNSKVEGGREGSKEGSGMPGSAATIHRVVKKPRFVSCVNMVEVKPRMLKKQAGSLLKDPKEVASRKVTSRSKGDSPPMDNRFTSTTSPMPRKSSPE